MKTKPHKNAWFLITLTLMSMAGLIGTDVYLPALPEMGVALKQNSNSMQLTLGCYLFGLAIGQLVLGFLTDRFGRKKILLISMGIFFIASIGCALSTNFYEILIFRVLQAFGACGGLVIGRVIVADLFNPQEVGNIFATIFPVVGMSPAVSPVIGGFIAYYLGWRADFVLMGVFAATIFVLSLKYIPETLAHKDRKPLKIKTIFTTYIAILFEKKFIYYAIAPCSAYIAFFAYIAQSPFIFHAQGFNEKVIGLFYITLSISYVTGNFVAKRFIKTRSLDEVLNIGFKYFILGALIFLCFSFLNFSIVLMITAISIVTFANGFLIPMGVAGVLSSVQGNTGYVSGLVGFFQLGVAGLTSAYIGKISLNQVDRLAEFIFLTVLLTICFRWIIRPAKVPEIANS